MMSIFRLVVAITIAAILSGCGFDESKQAFGLGEQCYFVNSAEQPLFVDQVGPSLGNPNTNPTGIMFSASDLGSYLMYTPEDKYIAFKNGSELDLLEFLESEVSLPGRETGYRLSEGVWKLEKSDEDTYLFYNPKSELFLKANGEGRLALGDKNNALKLTLEVTEKDNCSTPPESETGAELMAQELTTHWPNGELWGIADVHEHMTSNIAGHQSFMAGKPFHPLGIEHALHDCSKVHGHGGYFDFIYNAEAIENATSRFGEVWNEQELYDTSGYPDFTDWPSREYWSHQAIYYKWLERAHMSGLRFMTEYVTSQQVMCDMFNIFSLAQAIGKGTPLRGAYSGCNEMEGVDRSVQQLHDLERYVDAKNGGEGKGWLKIVTSPEQARDAIGQGKLAIAIGLEIENPYNCFSGTNPSLPECSESYLKEQMDKYYDLGIRAVFPVHKFNNGLASSDGSHGGLEILDLVHNLKARNYGECGELGATIAGRYEPFNKQSFFTVDEPTFDLVTEVFQFVKTHIPPLYVLVDQFVGVDGEIVAPNNYSPTGHCQRDGITETGRKMMKYAMQKGMFIDASHFSTKGLIDAYEMFEQYNYTPLQTHGGNHGYKMLDLGGVTMTSFRANCQDSSQPRDMYSPELSNYLYDLQTINAHQGSYKALVLGFDYNGFSDYVGARFGEHSVCSEPQTNPVTYPFNSFADDVELKALKAGNRVFDVNHDGMANIGLLPDVIQDHRNNGVTDEEFEPLFRGAEAYIRIWEKNIETSKDI